LPKNPVIKTVGERSSRPGGKELALTDYAIEAKDIWKSFSLGETRIDALRGLSFTLKRGEFVALVGSSGSGKSTLLHLLGALDKPDRGELLLAGDNPAGLDNEGLGRLRSRKTGFVFQSFHLIPVLDVFENVELPLHLFKELSKAQRQERVEEMLGLVGLKDFLHMPPSRLSGGQRQRVAIARALVTAPAIVLADEPTANLDSKTAHSIIDLMQELNQAKQASFLISSHDEKLIGRVSRVLRIKDGTLE